MSIRRLRAFPSTLPATPSRIPHLLTAIAAKQQRTALRAPSPAHCPSIHHASTIIPPRPSGSILRARTSVRDRHSGDDPDAAGTAKKVPTMIVLSGTAGFLMAIYTSYVYVTYQKALEQFEHTAAARELMQNSDVSSRYDDLGRDFDEEVGISEWMMGILRTRAKLVKEAMAKGGNVLEVGCGTGRNMGYYNFSADAKALPERGRRRAVERIVFNDKSRYMVSVAEKKYQDQMDRVRKRRRRDGKLEEIPVEFVVGDAGIRGVIQRPEGGFDTIIQTMGVCSITNPVSYLQTLGTLLRRPDPARPIPPDENTRFSRNETQDDDGGDGGGGGRILLLEHGKGHYDWLNQHLDKGAKMHADRFGCWWNKDIGEVVKEVEKLGDLKVERIKRYHFGTTWEVELRPVVKGQ